MLKPILFDLWVTSLKTCGSVVSKCAFLHFVGPYPFKEGLFHHGAKTTLIPKVLKSQNGFFGGFWIGSYVIKNIYDFLKFLSKVEECTTFEGKKIKESIWSWKRKVMVPQLFYYFLFIGSAGKRTYIGGKIWWPYPKKE